jgi:hypothetical protein
MCVCVLRFGSQSVCEDCDDVTESTYLYFSGNAQNAANRTRDDLLLLLLLTNKSFSQTKKIDRLIKTHHAESTPPSIRRWLASRYTVD